LQPRPALTNQRKRAAKQAALQRGKQSLLTDYAKQFLDLQKKQLSIGQHIQQPQDTTKQLNNKTTTTTTTSSKVLEARKY
jgi:hypothetical protein